MKKNILLSLTICAMFGCKDKESEKPTNTLEPYNSLSDFHVINGVKSEIFTFDAATGGSFISKKGTKITVYPNSFMDASQNLVSGAITLEFKDIYKKSDMLLTNLPTNLLSGEPLKSAGEFFLKAKKEGVEVQLTPNHPILIEQPLYSSPMDTAMNPYLLRLDSMSNPAWEPSSGDSLKDSVTSYIYSMYAFSAPLSGGTWSNSDNSFFFSNYPQTKLSIKALDNPLLYGTEVFLAFKGVNALVHVYMGPANDFIYDFAPIGLQCTLVAIGVKDHKLYYSMKDITITDNLTTSFTFQETNTEELTSKLKLLDN